MKYFPVFQGQSGKKLRAKKTHFIETDMMFSGLRFFSESRESREKLNLNSLTEGAGALLNFILLTFSPLTFSL